MSIPESGDAPKRPGFPFLTVAATLVTLFAFVFLTWLAYREGSPLGPPTPTAPTSGEAKTAPNVEEIRARNEAALNGVGAKMSRDQARGELLKTLKTPDDKLPFPTPDPQAPPAPKKDEKKDGPKGKADEKKGKKKGEEDD